MEDIKETTVDKLTSYRHCEVVTYPEHYTEEELKQALDNQHTITHYAFILHDKDLMNDGTPKKPHYHIYVKFDSPKKNTTILKMFKPSSVHTQKINGREKDMLGYLTHSNAPTKFQYPHNIVVSNYDWQATAATGVNKKLNDYLIQIEQGLITRFNFTKLIDNVVCAKNYNTILRALDIYDKNNKQNYKKNVVYIYGQGGTGKTSYAKHICEERGLSYSISTSDIDILSSYNGEDVLIIDDWRDDNMKWKDFLALCDPYNSTELAQRFRNKAFTGHTIIITTTKAPYQLYNLIFEDKHQLYRRLPLVLHFTYVDEDRQIEPIIAHSKYDEYTQLYLPDKITPNPLTEIIKKNTIIEYDLKL